MDFAICEVVRMNTFVHRLRKIIKEKGTISEFAEISGISLRSLSNYLNKGTDPGLKNLIKIAEVGGVSIDWLATGNANSRSSLEKTSENSEFLEPRIIWNVAYFLAEESNLIKADPTSLADTIISLSNYIRDEEDGDTSTSKVMSFAAAQMKKANNG